MKIKKKKWGQYTQEYLNYLINTNIFIISERNKDKKQFI